ncbi:MAG: hypothetical protein ACOZJX_16065 [Pseudomonadota bacterium]
MATSSPSSADPQRHRRDHARLRRVRDRIDREFDQPLDVEALARGVNMSAGHLSRQESRSAGRGLRPRVAAIDTPPETLTMDISIHASFRDTLGFELRNDVEDGVRDCAVRDPAGNMVRIQQLR